MARRGASRGNKSSTPSLLWLFTGILIGLGLAWYGASKGWIAAPKSEPASTSTVSPRDETPLADEMSSGKDKPAKSQYDFFTVLPEMEVVVPEQELSANKQAEETAVVASTDADSYILQVGSFRASGDAEQMKARLALQGFAAQVQQVTVNDETWHRVRIGPVAGAGKADDMRRQLSQAGIDSLVMKNP